MATAITTYEYTDPRTLDGTPFEVAEAAFAQALAASELLEQALHDGFVMARVAEMERELQRDEEPDGANFEYNALGIRIHELESLADSMCASIRIVGRAASYNPRKPPRELPA